MGLKPPVGQESLQFRQGLSLAMTIRQYASVRQELHVRVMSLPRFSRRLCLGRMSFQASLSIIQLL